MEWLSILLLLICPLMMIFMMKGHKGGGHHHEPRSAKDLNTKMSNIELENEKLRKEIDALSTMVKKES
ncbi:DUF2933 domain-containing protein [Peribacillus frigoritolerans]|uniref:DUF2933 domain-containing protein n=1 Tax=Peribacillus frigoritolerans TaxID=450367 RepID=UPI0007BF856C|nr:DUF2933 domain-containing protein [Peribacillus frigoritolerans]USK67036.1 DUF2933 domain-containing protein [Peribacillus frigoritolerans]